MNKKAPKDVSIELVDNINDLRSKVIKAGDIDIVASQTGICDKLEIERVLIECGNDISLTIIRLMSLEEEKKKVKEPTEFDQIREILADKEQVYHDVMKTNRQTQ
jgi:5,10-methylenetetrahydrofolate reductase